MTAASAALPDTPNISAAAATAAPTVPGYLLTSVAIVSPLLKYREHTPLIFRSCDSHPQLKYRPKQKPSQGVAKPTYVRTAADSAFTGRTHLYYTDDAVNINLS
jgi:hypothetical protein